MATTRVKVEGLRELEAALAELPKATGKLVLRRIATKALQPFDRAWRANAPRLTGSLEESGGVGTKLTRRQARLNKRRNDKDAIEVFAGPNDPAAVQDEFGNEHQAAQPFARPAWDSTKGPALKTVKNDLGAEIEKAAQRVARRQARLIAKVA